MKPVFSERSKTILLIYLSLLILLAGSAYLLFLRALFPRLVPHYGGGEGFTLSRANYFTSEIPWSAHSRLHLGLRANDTVELYWDGDYVCVCSDYEIVIEAGEHAMLSLRSGSPVQVWFTARQEIPMERQLLALGMIFAGLTGVALSIRRHGMGDDLDVS